MSYLERLLKNSTVIPAINQIELVEFSQSKGIAITAYSPFGSTGSPLAYNEVAKKIAEKKGVSPYTILISL